MIENIVLTARKFDTDRYCLLDIIINIKIIPKIMLQIVIMIERKFVNANHDLYDIVLFIIINVV